MNVLCVLLCTRKRGKAVDPRKTPALNANPHWKLVIPVGCLYLKRQRKDTKVHLICIRMIGFPHERKQTPKSKNQYKIL
jgi:hypothetical protein